MLAQEGLDSSPLRGFCLLEKHLVAGLGRVGIQLDLVELGPEPRDLLFVLLANDVDLVVGILELGLQGVARAFNLPGSCLSGLLELGLEAHGSLVEFMILVPHLNQ